MIEGYEKCNNCKQGGPVQRTACSRSSNSDISNTRLVNYTQGFRCTNCGDSWAYVMKPFRAVSVDAA